LISICLRCGAIFQFLTDAQFTSHSMCLQLWAPAIHPTISFTGCISLSLVHRCEGSEGIRGRRRTLDRQLNWWTKAFGPKVCVCLRDSPPMSGSWAVFLPSSKSRTCRSRTKYLTPAERIYGRVNLCVLLASSSLPFPFPVLRLSPDLIVIVHDLTPPFCLRCSQYVCTGALWGNQKMDRLLGNILQFLNGSNQFYSLISHVV